MFLTARRLAALEADTAILRRENRQLERRITALESRMELRAHENGEAVTAIAVLRNAVERLAARVGKRRMPPEIVPPGAV